jgi:DNA ligase (NAD+)
VRDPDEAAYFCPNVTGCAPQIKGAIEHFVSRKAMNINAGEGTVEAFFNAGLIHNVGDLYELNIHQILTLERWAEKSARNFLESIRASKTVPFERVLYALGIRHVGATVAKRLAQTFHSMDNLRAATFEQLTEVDDIGEQIANSVLAYFADTKNVELIEKLRAYGLQMTLSEEEIAEKTDVLQGKTFVISGTFQKYSRDDYKKAIEKNGGKNTAAVSAKTDFILAGDNMGPAKLEKAEKLGIKIINEDEFLAMIQ